MRILGIETSCDDTGASVVETSGGLRRPSLSVRANVISSQVKTHAPFGGVVPSLAAREHAKNLAPVLQRALRNTGYGIRDMDLIAVTTHPGLMPSLVVGVHCARALAWMHKKPIIGINHLAGHAASILLPPINSKKQDAKYKQNPKSKFQIPNLEFPAVGLIVSGGHTQLVLQKELGRMRIIGETRDDAAGETFDKIARLLGLPYPGGPAIAAVAAKYKIQDIRYKPTLPRPMIHTKDFDLSFSGLKTAVFYLLRDLEKTTVLAKSREKKRETTQKTPSPIPYPLVAAICAEVQQAIIDVLVSKTIRAAKKYHARTVFLAGGVAANKELRYQLGETSVRELPNTTYVLPPIPYTQDNAAMIAAAGYLDWLRMTPSQRKRATWQRIQPKT